jgi:hypothetical protein
MKSKIPKKITSLYPPTVVDTQSGRYAVYSGGKDSGWYPVSKDFTMEDALKRWVKLEVGKADKSGDWTWQVENSKKNGFYTVKFDKQGWSCTCTGFGFRRTCKHVEQTKKKIN